jgi:hypothetical protein
MVENGRLKLGGKNWTIMVVGTPTVSNLTQASRNVHGAFSCSKLKLENVGESVNGQVNF